MINILAHLGDHPHIHPEDAGVFALLIVVACAILIAFRRTR